MKFKWSNYMFLLVIHALKSFVLPNSNLTDMQISVLTPNSLQDRFISDGEKLKAR